VFSHASVASNSGDPYVAWVDQMLANNGQPLTVGSAPIYGTYMDGTEALVFCGGVKIAIGVFFVAEGTVAALAGGPVGIGLGLTSVWMGANSIGDGLMALATAQPNPGQSQGLTAQQALSQAAPAVAAGAELVGTWWMVGPSLIPLRPFPVGGGSGSGASWDGALGRGEQRLQDLTQGGALTEGRGFSTSELMAEEGCWARRACFAAGTPLLTPTGDRVIEAFRAGDWVLAAPDGDPERAPEPRQVEQVFRRQARLLEVRVGGRGILTTAQHRFWKRGAGWRAAALLQKGDELRGHEGCWVTVEEVLDTGEHETVYNLRVADYHTYFVGSREWGFSVWVHNSYDNAFEGTRGRLEQADLLEQPGMHETTTQEHHPFFRMFRDAMDMADYNVRTPSGRMVGQDLQELELLEHQDLHAEWNSFVDSRGYNAALRAEEGGRLRLADALQNGEITPHQIYKALEQFYTETGNDAALQSLREYGRRLGINEPWLPL
jgi:hypothetical protein